MLPSRKKGLPNQGDAEEIALQALVFMTEDRDRLARFLAETGLEPAELSVAATRPEILGAVLQHLAADESMLLVFASGSGIDPATIEPARAILAGEDQVSGW